MEKRACAILSLQLAVVFLLLQLLDEPRTELLQIHIRRILRHGLQPFDRALELTAAGGRNRQKCRQGHMKKERGRSGARERREREKRRGERE